MAYEQVVEILGKERKSLEEELKSARRKLGHDENEARIGTQNVRGIENKIVEIDRTLKKLKK